MANRVMSEPVSAFAGPLRVEGYRDVSVEALSGLGLDVRVIDVREPAEFEGELGHLERAELVPLSSLAAASNGWNRAQPVLLVCRSGNRSGQAARLLSERGFRDVGNLVGGMLAVSARS